MKDANSDVKSYDNDGGFLVCQTKTINQTSMMFTGRISLADVEDPEFKVAVYDMNGRLICRVTGDAIILVSPGVYVATTPRQSFKLIVR